MNNENDNVIGNVPKKLWNDIRPNQEKKKNRNLNHKPKKETHAQTLEIRKPIKKINKKRKMVRQQDTVPQNFFYSFSKDHNNKKKGRKK